MLGVIVGLLGCRHAVVSPAGAGHPCVSSADVVAEVDDQSVTTTDIRSQLNRLAQNGAFPLRSNLCTCNRC